MAIFFIVVSCNPVYPLSFDCPGLPTGYSIDDATASPLTALPGGVSVTSVKFFIAGGAEITRSEFFHQTLFFQRTALT
jgi:hypothetical protein